MVAHSPDSLTKILKQLFFLSNITILLVILMVVFAITQLQIKLPVWPLSLILLIMVGTNLYTRVLLKNKKKITDNALFFQLLVDVISFSLILYFAGGATNPFTFFYLIPLAIAATVIPGIKTWILAVLTICLYTLLLKYFYPLIYEVHPHHSSLLAEGQFNQHILGMWFGFIVSALLVIWFITHLAQELKRSDRAITKARERELNDAQIVMLGTLAAGTAHELGTPLATLSIIAEDITEGYNPDSDTTLFENRKVLKEQISRCKTILSVLSESAPESRATEGFKCPANLFIEQLIESWLQQRPLVVYKITTEPALSEVSLLSDKTIQQAFINLLNNAADASKDKVDINVKLDESMIQMEISNNGGTMTDEHMNKAGKFTFSTKPDGMGIGLFLAIKTIRRMDGTVQFKRGRDNSTATLVRIPAIEAAKRFRGGILFNARG